MVLHPTVIACGASDGSDYSKRRVLKKAEVWMGGGGKYNESDLDILPFNFLELRLFLILLTVKC